MKMFEFLEELFENRTQETGTGGREGTETPNESASGTMENTRGGGFYIKNGILYNGSIDTMLRPAHPGLPRQRADRLGVIARDDLDVHFVLLKEADAVRGVFAQRVADDDRC